MKHKLLFILCICLCLPAWLVAQQENVWIFGEHAGLDFSNGAPTPIQTQTAINFNESCASVCNANGQLLFYTDGRNIADRSHQLMPNGVDLIPFQTASTSQGSIIIPYPDQPDLYYVFSLTCNEENYNKGRLYYSVVDMSLNSGMGDVVVPAVLLDSNLTEKMTAVTGDRCNIWLLVCSQVPQFKAYEITASGIGAQPVVSTVGLGDFFRHPGAMVVAPNRKKLAATSTHESLLSPNAPITGACLYDFNPLNGIVSNPLPLLQGDGINNSFGICFSEDNTKLYVNNYDYGSKKLFQFDVGTNDSAMILISKTPIASDVGFGHLKLGPDKKVYFNDGYNNQGIAVINNPNLPGLACQYEPNGIQFSTGFRAEKTLPNVVPVIRHDTFYTQQALLSEDCFHAIITALDDSTGWDYVWNTGVTGESLEVFAPGAYWVSYRTPPCNFHTDTFEVAFPYGVLPLIHVDTACAGTANGGAYAVTYPGDTVMYQYTWLNGTDTVSLSDTLLSAAAGNYTLLVHTAHCDTSLNLIIPEVDYQVDFTLSDTLLCTGNTLHVQNTSDGHFNQFTWYFGDGDSSLLAAPAGHIYPYSGSYELMLMGKGTICQDTAINQVVIDSAYALVFQMDQREICVGDRITFTLPDADTSFAGLYWRWGEGSYLLAAYESSVVHAFDQPGVWPVQVTLKARVCPDATFTDTVLIHALPEVNLGADTSLCLDGHVVVLHNLSPAPDTPYHYLWSTGDTTASLRVRQTGSYSLRVTTEPLGCNITDAIVVGKDCYTDIPNAFTPNGDGDNDFFFPRAQLSRSVSSFKMQVFNRWGQLVFETKGIDGRGWDGRYNDKDQPLGVYVYLIDVAYANGRQEQYKGNVTLIR